MPLIIIAIIFLIGLLIYVIVGYSIGINDGPLVRDRFPDKFRHKKSPTDFTVEEVESFNSGDNPESSDDGKNIYFPSDNIELEKHKRNIQ